MIRRKLTHDEESANGRRFPWQLFSSELVGTAALVLVGLSLVILMFGAGVSRGWYELLSRCVVIFAAFVPFFSFKELERVIGPEKLRALFWKRGAPVTGINIRNTET